MHSKSTTTFYSLKVVSTIKNRISNAQQIYHSEIKCRPFYFIYRLQILLKENVSKEMIFIPNFRRKKTHLKHKKSIIFLVVVQTIQRYSDQKKKIQKITNSCSGIKATPW